MHKNKIKIMKKMFEENVMKITKIKLILILGMAACISGHALAAVPIGGVNPTMPPVASIQKQTQAAQDNISQKNNAQELVNQNTVQKTTQSADPAVQLIYYSNGKVKSASWKDDQGYNHLTEY